MNLNSIAGSSWALLASLFSTAPLHAASGLAVTQSPLPTHATEDCGTRLRPEDITIARWLDEHGLYFAQPPEFLLSVPTAIHVVRQSNGTGGMTGNEVAQVFTNLNNNYGFQGMAFFQTGGTDFIDNDNFFSGINTQAEIDQLRGTNVVANAMNVYFTPTLAYEGGGLNGISSFTFSPVQGIVLRNGATPAFGNPSTAPHEVGHYFDLFHTHETMFGMECPNGSNCSSAGDLVCDTPADPDLTNLVNANCQYTGNALMCFQLASPDPTNFMSYSTPGCRTGFSTNQRNRAVATLMNLRSNLLQVSGWPVTWVDFFNPGFENGSFSAPFNTLGEGVNAAPSGGKIVMRNATSSETLLINKSVTLDTFLGTALIGH